MPQGEAAGSVPAPLGATAAARDGAARHYRAKAKGRRHGAQSAPITPGFAAALHGMTAAAEAIAASKMLRAGELLRLKDVAGVGRAELRARAAAARTRNPVTALLERAAAGRLKGVRGAVDPEELAAADPELRALLDHRRATAGGGAGAGSKRPRDEAGGGGSARAVEAVAAVAAAAAARALARAPGGGVGAGGGGGGGGGGGRGARRGAAARGGLRGPGGAPLAVGSAGGDPVFASDAVVSAALGEDFL